MVCRGHRGIEDDGVGLGGVAVATVLQLMERLCKGLCYTFIVGQGVGK